MFFILSVNYKTATAEKRERFALSEEEQEKFIHDTISVENIDECAVLCTCNRSEFYFCGNNGAIETVQNIISEIKGFDASKYMKYYSVFTEEKAVRHLFKVASGLDSMLLGEDEILGQLKNAFSFAKEHNSTGYVLNTLSQAAVTCAKKIKTDTEISRTSVSLGTLAANAAYNFKDGDKTVLIIGMSGKMGSIITKNLISKGNINIIGTLRSHNGIFTSKSEYQNVLFVDYMDRYDFIDRADVIISATAGPHYTITCDEVEKHCRTHKKRLFIDLAMPRDIDKNIIKMGYTELIDLDNFDTLAKKNNEIKLKEAERGCIILEDEMDEALKNLYFREYMDYIPKAEKIIEEKGFETFIHRVKSNANSEQLKDIMQLLKNITEGE